MPENSPLKHHILHSSGIYHRIKVITRQPKSEYIETLEDGTIKIRLKAVAEKGKANAELIRYLSQTLDISESSISILS